MRTPADLARLGLASEADLAPLRDAYWRRVTDAGVVANGNVFVDKHPLNGLKLPLIARLFPEARILIALRDPRDVVWSCFRRRFRMSAPYYELLTLEGAAGLYDAVMEHHPGVDPRARSCARTRCTLETADRGFRRRGAAASATSSASISDRQMREFAARARERGVATASGAQIARGLNAGGVGEWRRYRDAARAGAAGARAVGDALRLRGGLKTASQPNASVQDAQHHAAILLAPVVGVVARDRLALAIAARGERVRDAAVLQVLEHRRGAPRRQIEVVGVRTAAVGVAGDFDLEIRITLERRDRAFEHRHALGQQVGLVGLEHHAG